MQIAHSRPRAGSKASRLPTGNGSSASLVPRSALQNRQVVYMLHAGEIRQRTSERSCAELAATRPGHHRDHEPTGWRFTLTTRFRPVATKKTTTPELPTLQFATARAFGDWLAEHHATVNGIWIRFAKKGSGVVSATYMEALEEALCWGWIDGQARRVDDTWYVQKFTPRRARSIWSKINCTRVTALTEAGRMKPPGLAEIERAKQDGRWDQAYDS